jgi:hypothetical protein
MRTVYAAALAGLFMLGGAATVLASDSPPTGESRTTPSDSGADSTTANAPKDQSKPESDEGTGGKDTASTIDVHRHRPGACPEGPPCKVGD